MIYSKGYKAQKQRYHQCLQRNIDLLEDLVFCEQSSFPSLSKMLSRGQAKRRLYALLLYFFQYGNTAPLTEAQLSILNMKGGKLSKEEEFKCISYHSQRKCEMFLSFPTMESTLCQDKHWDDKGWERYVYLFMGLGLLRRHLPGQHANTPGANTPLQEVSLEKVGWKRNKDGEWEEPNDKKKRRQAVTWYHVPDYERDKNFILRRAEKRARLFIENRISVSNICKDALRDVLGEESANIIWDTVKKEPYDDVQRMRDVIEAVLCQQLETTNGYTTEERLLGEVYERYGVGVNQDGNDDDMLSPSTVEEVKKLDKDSFTRYKIRDRWRKMKPYFSAKGIKAVPPRKEDRIRWNLPDDFHRWIIIDTNKYPR